MRICIFPIVFLVGATTLLGQQRGRVESQKKPAPPLFVQLNRGPGDSERMKQAMGEFVQANNYLNSGDSTRAVQAFNRAIELRPDFYTAHFNLGATFLDRGQYEGAVAAFKRATKLLPRAVKAWQGLGLAYYRLHDYEHASRAYEKAAEVEPNATLFSNLGFALLHLHREEQAATAFKNALTIDPNLKEAVGGICFAASRFDPRSALEDCTRAVKNQPDSPLANYSLGNVYLATGRFESAVDAFEKAQRLEPTAATVVVGLGHARFQLKNYRTALDVYTRAAKLDPRLAIAYVGQGLTYYHLNKFKEAEASFRKALSLDPEKPTSYFNLGMICVRRSDRGCALEQYNQLQTYDPSLAKKLFREMFRDKVIDARQIAAMENGP